MAAFTGIAFDLWLLALPFPLLLALNVHWKKKVMGGLMFSVGTRYVISRTARQLGLLAYQCSDWGDSPQYRHHQLGASQAH